MSLPKLNSKILNFAQNHLGKRVIMIADNNYKNNSICTNFLKEPSKLELTQKIKDECNFGKGECWDLAFQAIKEAGGKTPWDYYRLKGEDIYIWSNSIIDKLENALPGDIIQFHYFAPKYKIKIGSATVNISPPESIAPRHTAIIKENLGKGAFSLYEQNAKGKKIVIESRIYLGKGPYEDDANNLKYILGDKSIQDLGLKNIISNTKLMTINVITTQGTFTIYRAEALDQKALLNNKSSEQIALFAYAPHKTSSNGVTQFLI
jgi:hypothetical protein